MDHSGIVGASFATSLLQSQAVSLDERLENEAGVAVLGALVVLPLLSMAMEVLLWRLSLPRTPLAGDGDVKGIPHTRRRQSTGPIPWTVCRTTFSIGCPRPGPDTRRQRANDRRCGQRSRRAGGDAGLLKPFLS